MNLSRRQFLAALLAVPVAIPAAKAVYVVGVDMAAGPDATVARCLSIEDLNQITLRYIVPRMRDIFFAESPLMARLSGKYKFSGGYSRPIDGGQQWSRPYGIEIIFDPARLPA